MTWLINSYFALSRIKEIFETDRDVEKEDFNKLIYTEAVIKESLRVFTTGPVTLRHVEKDVKLSEYIYIY